MLVPSVKGVLEDLLPKLTGASHLNVVGAAEAESMYGFDDAVIAPMMGLNTAAEYYHEASAKHTLNAVRVPLLFVRCEFFDIDLHSRMPWHSSRVCTHLTGSHCKFRPNTKGLGRK